MHIFGHLVSKDERNSVNNENDMFIKDCLKIVSLLNISYNRPPGITNLPGVVAHAFNSHI